MILEPDETRIRLRPECPDYAMSMSQAVYIEECKDVLAYLHCFNPRLAPKMTEITQRYQGFDERNGWHSWLIALRSKPVLWTDKEVPGIAIQR